MALPVLISQRLMVELLLPDARVLPLGLKATEVTPKNWNRRVLNSLPLVTSQRLTFISMLPEARILPSGLNTTEVTELE